MKTRLVLLAVLLAGVAGIVAADDFPGISAGGYTSPDHYEGMTLVWRDEFDGDMLDFNSWEHETGTGSDGWGNEELQYYRPENTRVRDGYLVITAREEAFGGSNYTSSRIVSRGKVTARFGRVDIRAKLPEGQGIWPALWMLGATTERIGWPVAGEIDIMEMVGGQGRESTVHGTLHWSNKREHRYEGGSVTLPSGDFSDQFHVFSIAWDETVINWMVDGMSYFQVNIASPEFDAFREEFYLLINLAVGGKWPGNPDASTSFPQHLAVDYIRVFTDL